MSRTGHRSGEMVSSYLCEANLFEANPAGVVGL
jgi:hypothetical protein